MLARLLPLMVLLGLAACSGAERTALTGPAVEPPAMEAPGLSPRFEDYPVGKVEGVRPARVDLSSHPEAREFTTVLSRGAAQGPNFAGRYTVVTWGCGTMCQRALIVDAGTGRVLTDLVAPFGFDYRPGSRLLAANPPEAARAPYEQAGKEIELSAPLWADRAARA